ncbi:c-type cytochrome [Dyella sp. KRB-257]|uniref:c-type cytochrome n=1 Tax=Dyella sp. KRB-257 TaxID=3400915 RepID=UPI003C05F7BB
MNLAHLPLLLMTLMLVACEGGRDPSQPGLRMDGNPAHGKQLISQYTCGACHVIPGIHGADGLVGPPLTMFGRRAYIGGELPNTPANLQRWLLDPPAVEPGTAMPRLGLSRAEARDVAAYLSTLR